MSMPRPIRVAIAAYDGVSLLDLSGPLEALRLASTHPNHLGTKLAYDCHVVSVVSKPALEKWFFHMASIWTLLKVPLVS